MKKEFAISPEALQGTLAAIIEKMPKGSRSLLTSASADNLNEKVIKINNNLDAFRSILATENEATPECVANYISKGAYYRSEEAKAKTQKLIDSWVGFPAAMRSEFLEKAVADINTHLEGEVARFLVWFAQQDIDLLKDVSFGEQWVLSEKKISEMRASHLTHIPAEVLEDYFLFNVISAIYSELGKRGYDKLSRFDFDSMADNDASLQRVLYYHSAYYDYRTPEDVKAEMRRRAAEGGVII